MIRLSDYDTEQEGLVRCGRKPSSPGAGLLCYRLLSGSRPGALAGLCSNSGDCCGGYSWVSGFFFVQSLKPLRKIRVVGASLDAKIPFLPQWMWVYGVRYYVFLGLPIAFIETAGELMVFIAGGSVVLLIAIPMYIFWPTESPPEWRSFPSTGISARFLTAIQSLDNGRACFPSLHCALPAYSVTFLPYRPAAIAIPIAVSMSCVFVKQHSILDIPVSLVAGMICGMISHLFI